MSRTPQIHEHVPTDRTRHLVETWAMVGTPHHVIASQLDISVDTLTRRYKPELTEAQQRGLANVAATLYSKAMAGDVAALIFYLKSKGRLLGWIDKPDPEAVNVTVQLDVVKSIEQAFASMKRAAVPGQPGAVSQASIVPKTIEHRTSPDEDGRDLL